MIDLHMHSKYSDDGEFSPAELVRQCAEAGITVMSITDHNCVRANAEARSAALSAGIRYIAGIEIDCVLSGVNFHVLGYGIDFESEDFIRIEENCSRSKFLSKFLKINVKNTLDFGRVFLTFILVTKHENNQVGVRNR